MNFGIYLASLFTIGNMGCGLFSIIKSMQFDFISASWFVLIAIIIDGFDGLIARASNSASLIGVQLDSFSDLVSFCIAPAILMYQVVLKFYGLLGFGVALLFVFFGALRLGKFNIKSCETKKVVQYFEGLPTPAAGGILASCILMLELFYRFEDGNTQRTIPILMSHFSFMYNILPILIIILGFLMITKFRYLSPSKMRFSRKVSVRMFVMIFLGVFLVISYPESMIFIIFVIYILSGLFEYLWRLYSIRRRPEANGL